MSTKIELEEPFKCLWKYGYLVTNKEPRRNVILYNSHKDRTTISYARYLMSVHLGRMVDEDLVVDHINGDKLDDRIENYQIISTKENNQKAVIQNPRKSKFVEIKCGFCGNNFVRYRNQTHLVIKSKKSDYCSKRCAARGSSLKLFSEVIREFEDLGALPIRPTK